MAIKSPYLFSGRRAHRERLSPLSYPVKVQQCMELATQQHFTSSCLSEVGMVLQLLASNPQIRSVAELGTGCGVGTAWLSSCSTAKIHTIDHNKTLYSEVSKLFRDITTVHVHCGPWTDVLRYAPFDLIFVDIAQAKIEQGEAVIDSLMAGDMVLLDDLTPKEFWPPEWIGRVDPVRQFWLTHPQLLSIELQTSKEHSLIVARKRTEI